MHVVFMGPPGSGKGTQAVRLAGHLDVPHLSTGDMLRENKRNGTALGQEAAKYMDAGNLVPDELVLEMLTERILQEARGRGWYRPGPRDDRRPTSTIFTMSTTAWASATSAFGSIAAFIWTSSNKPSINCNSGR